MVHTEKITIAEAHLLFAKSTNGEVWTLLSKENRSEAEDQILLTAAYASLYHWSQIGTNVNIQRGHWLLSHVLSALHQPDHALAHATMCLEITNKFQNEMKDFDIAYAHEALARAYAGDGKMEIAKDYYKDAKNLGDRIMDEEDKKIFLDDLNKGILSKLA